MSMEIRRKADGEATLVADDGRELADITPVEGTEEEIEAILRALEAGLGRGPVPKVLVAYREGLFAEAHADKAVEVVMVEDDPNDEPTCAVIRRQIKADPTALEVALTLAERRATRGPQKR